MAVDWRYSPSQIEWYELCERKWAWKYIDEVFVEGNAAAEFGTEVHGRLEDWLKNKKVPDDDRAGKLAQTMIPHLPAPHLVKPEYVEKKFQLKIEELYFTGVVDLTMPDDEIPIIMDHKTTSDMRWAKTPESLVVDPQATIYAYWAFIHFAAERVGLQWTYGVTRGSPRAIPVERVVTKKEIEPRLLQSLQSAREMELIRQSGVRALDVSYDASACEAFGGCPFKEKCNLDARERMMAIMSQGEKKANFLSKLQERRGQQPAAEATPTPPPAEEPPPKNGDGAKSGGLFGKLKEKKAEQQTAAPAPAINPPEEGTEAPAPPPEPPKTTTKGRGKSKSKASSGWTLYIDCQPVKLPDGATAPADAGEIISGVTGVGEGRSGQIEEIRKALRETPPKSGVVLSTLVEEQKDARLAFMQEAAIVVTT